jgi:hypothetical protein
MIYEVCTGTVRPGARAEAYERMAAALPQRERLSPAFGFWHSELGVLNRLVQVWEYRDLGHLAEVRGSADHTVGWPPDVAPLLHDEEVEVWAGVPFVESARAGHWGQVYEMRTYTFGPGTMPRVLEVWAKAVPDRVRLSPLVACWYNVVGQRNRLRHIWAYESLDERARIRQEALELPDWPPMTREWRTHEESQILLPAPFSPLN